MEADEVEEGIDKKEDTMLKDNLLEYYKNHYQEYALQYKWTRLSHKIVQKTGILV